MKIIYHAAEKQSPQNVPKFKLLPLSDFMYYGLDLQVFLSTGLRSPALLKKALPVCECNVCLDGLIVLNALVPNLPVGSNSLLFICCLIGLDETNKRRVRSPQPDAQRRRSLSLSLSLALSLFPSLFSPLVAFSFNPICHCTCPIAYTFRV